MSVQLLDKTRKINKLLHNSSSSKVVFNDICQVLMDTLSSNILVLSKKGKVLGISLCPGVEEITELIEDNVGGHVDSLLNERFLGVLSTKENVNLQTLGRRQGQDLEGGARLIGVVQRLVAPLQQLHIGHGALPALDTLLQRLVADGQKVVQIVVGIRRHGQYAAGLGVHHDAAGTVGGGELIHHALDALFQIVLDGGVQRQRQVAAVLGGEILLIGIQHIVLCLILGGDCKTGSD